MFDFSDKAENKKYWFDVAEGQKFSDAMGFDPAKASLGLDTPMAVVFDGRLVSLDRHAEHSGRACVVPFEHSIGRRVYRSTLQVVFAAAASRVEPKRVLFAAHALGDGYFYFFTDGKGATPELATKISAELKKIATLREPIKRVRLGQAEAVKVFEADGRVDTSGLIKSRNRGFANLVKIGTHYEIEHFPVFPSAGVLSEWSVEPYEDGILLRVPPRVGSEIGVSGRVDAAKTFQSFKYDRECLKNFGALTLSGLNKKILSKNLSEYIGECEALQNQKIFTIAQQIIDKGDVRVVFVAGPSSSNKTTFASRLSRSLRVLGKKPIPVSLDDYYFTKDKVPRDEDGKLDLETIDAIDTALIKENLTDLIAGKEVHLPRYDFVGNNGLGTRTFDENPTQLPKGGLLVVEGIHALNPAITGAFKDSQMFRIFISALTQLNVDEHTRVSMTDVRIMRRIVRDERSRGASALDTLEMWDSVERGERKYIQPYQECVDAVMSSALEYEVGVLAPIVTPLLRTVGPEHPLAFIIARRLLAMLKNVYPIQKSFVPTNSMLHEFVGD